MNTIHWGAAFAVAIVALLGTVFFKFGVELTAVFLESDGVYLTVKGVKYHAEWLRERCQSNVSVHVSTLQPLHALDDFPPPRVSMRRWTVSR